MKGDTNNWRQFDPYYGQISTLKLGAEFVTPKQNENLITRMCILWEVDYFVVVSELI